MNKEKIVKFNNLELDFLLTLAIENKESGEYWGRKEYYYKRQDAVIEKIRNALEGK